MYKLTVHIENAPFFKKERKVVESKLSDIRKNYTIAKKQKSGGAIKAGEELVYISIH